MPTPTVRILLARRELGLTLLGPTDAATSASLDGAVSWVHSSDLADPTPFLAAGQALLTTGTQFAGSAGSGDADSGDSDSGDSDSDDSDYDGYVSRLADTGVVALGFGTEVVRATPPALVDACARHGLPLLEVPYRTPFIAIARYVADLVAEQAYARNTWALSAQRALSLAALRPDGLSATLAELARQLGGWVALTDAAGSVQRVFPARALSESAIADIETAAKRMLHARRRAASSVVETGTTASLQTIGASDRLLGVLAHGDGETDQAGQQVVTSVVALAGLALEQGQVAHAARSAVRAALVRALDDVQALAKESDVGLSGAEVSALDAARHRVDARLHRERADAAAAAGPAGPATGSSPGRGGSTGAATAGGGAAGLLPAADDPQIRSAATAILAPMTARDPEGVLAASLLVWLEHNGVYDSAARELGVHRHTLTARVRSAAGLLGRDFDAFADRAEVWTALRAARAAG